VLLLNMELRPGSLIFVPLISHVIHGDVGSFSMPSLQTLHVGSYDCYNFLGYDDLLNRWCACRSKKVRSKKGTIRNEEDTLPSTFSEPQTVSNFQSVAAMCWDLRSDDQPYIPPTKPYELSNLVKDLVVLARYLLKPGGRLVLFLPTVTDEYQEVDIHDMVCEGMQVIANSLQDFGSWGRRVRFRT